MTETEADPEFDLLVGRVAARTVVKMLGESNSALLEEHSAMGRWLTASLLALNGGATLAVFGALDRLSRPMVDIVFFGAGTLAALFVGVLMQYSNRKGTALVSQALVYAAIREETGRELDAADEFDRQFMPKMTKIGRPPPIAGWVSAVLFAAGAVSTGLDASATEKPNRARCDALQEDLLRARPMRTDSATLFTALGCKARGPGSVHAPRPDSARRITNPRTPA